MAKKKSAGCEYCSNYVYDEDYEYYVCDINLDEDESSIKEKVHSALEGKLDGKSIVKEIYVKNKIFNVVVK